MRLHRLELTQYGAFTGRAIDVGPGLTVVHGPNESGKSTLSHALGDLLWGLTARSHPYAFRVTGPQLRITADLSGPAAASDGSVDDITLVVDSRAWRSLDGVAVEPWWRAGPIASREQWATSLGLDRDRLRSGGRAVLAGGGDLAPLLFRVRSGVDLDAARATLHAAADKHYKKYAGAKGVSVRLAVTVVDRARSATAAATSSGAEVARLRVEHDGQVAGFRAADRHYAELRTVAQTAEESVRAWPPAAGLVATRERLATLRAGGRVLEPPDLRAHDDARTGVNDLTDLLARRDDLLRGLDEQIAGLEVDDDAVALGPKTDELRERRGVERARAASIPDLRAELAALLEKIRALVAEATPEDPVVADPAMPEDTIVSAAAGLLIAADVTDRLGRAATHLRELRRKVDSARDEVETALGRRVERSAPGGSDTEVRGSEGGGSEGGGSEGRSAASRAPESGTTESSTTSLEADVLGHLTESREQRDRAWALVREPWLSGVLPADGLRAQLASEVEAALTNADHASDALADQAESAGRLREADAQLDERVSHLDRLQHDLAVQQSDWVGLLIAATLPPFLDPDAWEVRRTTAGELAVAVGHHVTLSGKLAAEQTAVAQFAGETREVCARLGVVGDDHWASLESSVVRVDAARTDSVKAEGLRTQRAGTIVERDQLAVELAGHEAVLARLTLDDDLADVTRRSHEVVTELERERVLLEQVRAAAPRADVDDLIRRVGRRDQADLEAEETEAKERTDAALILRDSANELRTTAAAALETAQQVGSAADLHAREVEATELLAAEVEEYLQTRIMVALLERVLAVETPEEDNALVAHASRLVGRLTDGRVTGLTVQEALGLRRLRIEAMGLAEGVPAELSEGTADQVFLALRLAGIRQLQERAVALGGGTLPVLLDDVLMASDDARTAVALEVILEEARDQQILVLTHHGAVAGAAELLGATVVALEPLPDQGVEPTPLGRPRAARSDGAEDPSRIREWARAEGIVVGDRGRIKGWILEAYLARDEPDVDL